MQLQLHCFSITNAIIKAHAPLFSSLINHRQRASKSITLLASSLETHTP